MVLLATARACFPMVPDLSTSSTWEPKRVKVWRLVVINVLAKLLANVITPEGNAVVIETDELIVRSLFCSVKANACGSTRCECSGFARPESDSSVGLEGGDSLGWTRGGCSDGLELELSVGLERWVSVGLKLGVLSVGLERTLSWTQEDLFDRTSSANSRKRTSNSELVRPGAALMT